MSRPYPSPTRFACACALMLCVMIAACNAGRATPSPAPIVPYTAAAPGSCHANGALPDPSPGCTPTALNPAVTQDTIKQTICVVGWTATVRPPVSVTDNIKRERFTAYGYVNMPLSAAELDHAIPLELGGATDSVSNLWPELYVTPGTNPNLGAHEKDKVETYLKQQTCAGAMTLAMAQQEIRTDWTKVYQQMVRGGLVQAEPPGVPTPTSVD